MLNHGETMEIATVDMLLAKTEEQLDRMVGYFSDVFKRIPKVNANKSKTVVF